MIMIGRVLMRSEHSDSGLLGRLAQRAVLLANREDSLAGLGGRSMGYTTPTTDQASVEGVWQGSTGGLTLAYAGGAADPLSAAGLTLAYTGGAADPLSAAGIGPNVVTALAGRPLSAVVMGVTALTYQAASLYGASIEEAPDTTSLASAIQELQTAVKQLTSTLQSSSDRTESHANQILIALTILAILIALLA